MVGKTYRSPLSDCKLFLINGASDFDFGDASGQICALILTVCLTRLPHLKCFSELVTKVLLKTFGQQWFLHWQYSHQDDHQEDDPDDQHDDHEEGLDRRGDGCAGGGVIMWRMGSATDTFTLHYAILFIEQHFVLLSATDTSFTQHTADATLCTSL